MKRLLFTCAFLYSLIVNGQKPLEVFIVGTVHHFEEEFREVQDFEQVQRFVQEQDPDAIFIESAPTYDTLSIQEVNETKWKEAKDLRERFGCDGINSSNLAQGCVYFKDADFWNAYYQWFLVKSVGDTLGELERYYPDQSSTEFGNIIFPVAQKLEVEYLYGIDYRQDEATFLQMSSKAFKQLLLRFKWKPLGSYMKSQKGYRKAEKKGELLEYVNSNAFQRSFARIIEELPARLPKSEEAKFVRDYWLNRNEIMASRLESKAKELKASKVVLAVGSAHVYHIRAFLEAQGIQVFTYGDYIEELTQRTK